ncbi:hypothetical protein Tco_0494818 [Tanacetum coccineum]
MGTPTQCDMLCDTFWVSLVAFSASYSKPEWEIKNVSIMRKVKLEGLARETIGLHVEFISWFSFSYLLHGLFECLFDCLVHVVLSIIAPLCCDDTHNVTPRVSALAGCDIDDKDQALETPSGILQTTFGLNWDVV